jgi:hypothetical protein
VIRLVKAGDWLVIMIGLFFVAYLFARFWHMGGAQKVLIRKGGEVFAELSLDENRKISVPGPLGVSLVVISQGRARVAKDPGRHQYCVRQGWLMHAGDVAICLPNQVSVELLGAEKAYDSLNY